jgi:hypothetical protein
MTNQEPKHEPPIILRSLRVGLGPLRRELIPTYARWQADLEVLRGMGTSGQVPRVEATEAWYEQATKPDSADVHFTITKAGFREIGRRRGAVVTMGRRYDQVLMDAIADEFTDSVLARHIQPDEHEPDRA